MRYEGRAIAAGPAPTIKSALDRWLLTHIRPYSLEEYGRIEYGELPLAAESGCGAIGFAYSDPAPSGPFHGMIAATTPTGS
jgi:hypothetical protein